MNARVADLWYRIRVMAAEDEHTEDLRDRIIAELERALAAAEEAMEIQLRNAEAKARAEKLALVTRVKQDMDARHEMLREALAKGERVGREVSQLIEARKLTGEGLEALRKILDNAGVVQRDRASPTILEFLERTFIPERNLQEDASRHIQGYVRLFAKTLGDRPMNEYTRADIVRWVRTLENVRTSYGKGGKDHAKTIEVILRESRGKPTLGVTTIEKHITHLKQVFLFAIRHHRFGTSDDVEAMFDDIALGRHVPQREERKLWSSEHLIALFRSPIWSGTRARADDFTHRHQPGPHVHLDAYWWLPIIGLYSGMRLEEIAQLRDADLKRDGDGRAFIHVTDEGEGQRLKTNSSRRGVPVHPLLTSLGLEALFVPGRDSWVFPELKLAGRPPKRGGQFSEDFTAYRRAVGVYERLVDFHSFRHTAVTQMREAGADAGVVAFLTGHRTDPTYQEWRRTNGYTKFSVATYARALDRLDFEARGVDLSYLRAAARLAGGPRGTVRASEVAELAEELRAARNQ
jgi:integrase